MTNPSQPSASPSDPNLISSDQPGTVRRPRLPSPARPLAPRRPASFDPAPVTALRAHPAQPPAPVLRNRPALLGRIVARAAVFVVVSVGLLAAPSAAFGAAPGDAAGDDAVLAANSLPQVITNLQNWLIGILAAIATLFAVLAGVYWATAGGDPAQVERAKGALRNALIGYGAAVLAPVFLQIVRRIVGG